MIDGIFGMNRSREILEEKASEIEGSMQYARESRLRNYLDSTYGLFMYNMGMTDVIDVGPHASDTSGINVIPHPPSSEGPLPAS